MANTAKLTFTQEQQLDLTRRLQLLVLDSVAASGNWEKDSLRFQGGTCLSFSYGSSRFSEDLDFLLGTDKGLNRLLRGVQDRMSNILRLALPGAQLKIAARDADLEGADSKNPRTFMLTLSHPDWYRVIKVKVKFWLADPEAVRQYEARTITAKLLTQAVEGVPLRMALPPVMMPTATLQEILVDKLHALACRAYTKHRDVFDLWWLKQQGVQEWLPELLARYPHHSRMYSDSPSLPQLVAVLREKAAEIQAMVGKPVFSVELKKWLGENAALASPQSADAIALEVAARLERLTSTFEDSNRPESTRPARRPRP